MPLYDLAFAIQRYRECPGTLEPEVLLGETETFVWAISKEATVDGRTLRQLWGWRKEANEKHFWVERVFREDEADMAELRWLNCALKIARLLRENECAQAARHKRQLLFGCSCEREIAKMIDLVANFTQPTEVKHAAL